MHIYNKSAMIVPPDIIRGNTVTCAAAPDHQESVPRTAASRWCGAVSNAQCMLVDGWLESLLQYRSS